MQNQHKYILLFSFVLYFSLVAMKQSELLSLSDMQKHAEQCDDDHKCLSEEVTNFYSYFLNDISPLLKQLWAVDYIQTMLVKAKNIKNKKIIYGAWGTFANWYLTYIRNKIGNLNEKLQDIYEVEKPLFYATKRKNMAMLTVFSKLGVRYNHAFDDNPLLLAKSCGVAGKLIDIFNIPLSGVNHIGSLIANVAYYDDYNANLIPFYVDHGVPINQVDYFRKNALHHIFYEDVPFDWLAKEEEVMINISDKIQKIVFLVCGGIKINAIDANNRTPLDILLINHYSLERSNEKYKWHSIRSHYYNSVIQLLESYGAHAHNYIDDTLPTSKYSKKDRYQDIVTAHKQDIAAMYYVLKTSKTTKDCEQQQWPVEHQIVKIFADWYSRILNEDLQKKT